MSTGPIPPRHPSWTRRDFIQAGAIGCMGLSLAEVAASRGAAAATTPRSVIFIFLSGGGPATRYF